MAISYPTAEPGPHSAARIQTRRACLRACQGALLARKNRYPFRGEFQSGRSAISCACSRSTSPPIRPPRRPGLRHPSQRHPCWRPCPEPGRMFRDPATGKRVSPVTPRKTVQLCRSGASRILMAGRVRSVSRALPKRVGHRQLPDLGVPFLHMLFINLRGFPATKLEHGGWMLLPAGPSSSCGSSSDGVGDHRLSSRGRWHPRRGQGALERPHLERKF